MKGQGYILKQWLLAFNNIMSVKLRSFLAILGVMVGSAAVVSLVISGELATEKALEQFQALGTELLAVSLYQTDKSTTNNHGQITVNDWYEFKEKYQSIVDVAVYSTTYRAIVFAGHKIEGDIVASEDSLARIINIQLDQGAFVSHLHQYEKYCVVGAKIASQLRRQTSKNLIGLPVKISGSIYTIIGVLKEWKENAFFNSDINRSVLVPIRGIGLLDKNAGLNSVILKLKPDTDISLMINRIKKFVKEKAPSLNVFPRSAKQLIESMKAQGKIFTLLLGIIGGVSLLVGGIGVMNVMLVSVVERKKEIGLRKAIGANARDILQLFLIESMVLSFLGGCFGVLLGLLAAWIISYINAWPFKLLLSPILLGFIVSVSVGVFFGAYPAKRAAKLDAAECLRAE